MGKNKATLATLTAFLDRMDEEEIHYTVSSVREGVVTVGASVGDERWEVEFLADGEIDVEIFKSDGEIHGASMIEEMFERHEEFAD